MPEFHYRARNFNGAVIDGSVTTSTRAAAIAMVEALGAIPISIKSNGADLAQPAADTSEKTAESSLGSRDRLSFNHQFIFTEQLAHLLGAGLTSPSAFSPSVFVSRACVGFRKISIGR